MNRLFAKIILLKHQKRKIIIIWWKQKYTIQLKKKWYYLNFNKWTIKYKFLNDLKVILFYFIYVYNKYSVRKRSEKYQEKKKIVKKDEELFIL